MVFMAQSPTHKVTIELYVNSNKTEEELRQEWQGRTAEKIPDWDIELIKVEKL